jgi:hypothetical protein
VTPAWLLDRRSSQSYARCAAASPAYSLCPHNRTERASTGRCHALTSSFIQSRQPATVTNRITLLFASQLIATHYAWRSPRCASIRTAGLSGLNICSFGKPYGSMNLGPRCRSRWVAVACVGWVDPISVCCGLPSHPHQARWLDGVGVCDQPTRAGIYGCRRTCSMAFWKRIQPRSIPSAHSHS